MSQRVFWISALAGIFLVLVLSACGARTDAEVTATALAGATDSPTESSEPASNRLGEWTEDSGLALVARAVEDPAEPDTANYQPRPGTRLVAVQIELGSLADTHYGTRAAAKLIDSRGIKHEPIYGAMAEHSEVEFVGIAMGERVSGWLAYELPESTMPMFLEYKPDVWGRLIELRVSLTE